MNKTRDSLVKIATEMVIYKNMPSRFVEDWQWPKTMPKSAKRKVVEAAKSAEKQCTEWAYRLKQIIKNDEGDKLRAIWFEKGRKSIQRRNESGCCCIIDDDDNIMSVCGAHLQWLEDKTNDTSPR